MKSQRFGSTLVKIQDDRKAKGKGQNLTFKLPNFKAVIDVASLPTPSHYDGQSLGSRRDTGRKSWCLGVDFADAVKLAKTGWTKHMAAVLKRRDLLVKRVARQVPKTAVVYDVEGLDFDIGRVMDGEPEHWVDMVADTSVESGKGGKLRRVVVNVSNDYRVKAKAIVAKGILITSLVALMEFSGMNVQVELGSAIRSERGAFRWQWVAPFKRYSDALNIPKIMYAVAHPTMLRRLVFGLKENLSTTASQAKDIGVPNGGYGSPMPLSRDLHGDIYIDNKTIPTDKLDDDDYLADWLLEQLRRQGVQITN